MSDHLSYQANAETRGTAPVQFFDAGGGVPPPGTKATPRPAGRPRELPPGDPASATFQLFESDGPSGTQATTGPTPPAGRERDGG
jgi:hypothetical protein